MKEALLLDDPDFRQAVEDVASEINAKQTFRERIKEEARTARLLIELVLLRLGWMAGSK